jgi:hypothetical protein
MDILPEQLEQLTARLEDLERRVRTLEHSPAPASQAAPPVTFQPAILAQQPPLSQAGVFSVLGKAMLGIAGAYVLRAVAESGALPRVAVAAVAIAYAILWLVWAARVKSTQWFASVVYATTSALILAPMLWELTLRFQVLSPGVTALILGGFVVAASVLTWKRDLTSVLWIVNLTTALLALALSVATHRLLPFIATLLLMVLLSELAASQDRLSGLRVLVSLIAGAAVWALIFIYAGEPAQRADYPQIGAAMLLAPAISLFVIFLAGVGIRTVLKKQRISIFETVQTLVAFLLMAAGLLYFVPNSGAAILGVVCLAFSVAGYLTVFLLLGSAPEPRNFNTFAAWSAALLLAGSWLLVPPAWLAVCLAVAAILAFLQGIRLRRMAIQFHGLLLLLAAALAAGLPGYVFAALAGTVPAAISGPVSLVAACAAVCYLLIQPARSQSRTFTRLVCASVAISAAAAIILQVLAIAGLAADAFHLAFMRTLVTCVFALAIAFSGSRWQKVEWNWIAYAILAFVAAKLLFEDLRHGHLVFIAASIFVYALTLIAVPRLVRMGQKTKIGSESAAHTHVS